MKNAFLFHLKSLFRPRDVQILILYFRLPLFFSQSAIALEDDRRSYVEDKS